MKTRYTSYECAPVRATGSWNGTAYDEVERCDPDDAEFYSVYGRNPDGTAQHIGDAFDSDSAESFVALLNYLIAPEKEGA